MSSDDAYLVKLFRLSGYKACLDAFKQASNPTETATLYAVQSAAALGLLDEASQLLTTVSVDTLPLNVAAVSALLTYLKGDLEDALAQLEEVLIELGESGLTPQDDSADGRLVRSIIGTVYFAEGSEDRVAEAVELLKEGIDIGQDESCLVVLTHIYCAKNRGAYALQTLEGASFWTLDSPLSQLLTARAQLSLGQNVNNAYYTYEETRNLPGLSRSASVLSGLAISQALLGRYEEAQQVLSEQTEDPETALANSVALGVHGKKGYEALLSQLEAEYPTHLLVLHIKEKEAYFDTLLTTFESV